jgi:hypothetical protein
VIENLFYSLLTSSVPISGACGSNIWPLVLPNSPTLPAITYSFVGGTANPTFNTSGLTRYRVEVNCYGKSYTDAYTLRSAVKAALNGYSDANMTIEFMHPIDFFDHEVSVYRCAAEFYLFSVL